MIFAGPVIYSHLNDKVFQKKKINKSFNSLFQNKL